MYLKIRSSPTGKILFSTHIHKHACPYMHPEWMSVNAAKPPSILAPVKLKTDKQRGKHYLASFVFNRKIPSR